MLYTDNYRDILKNLIQQRPRGELTRIAEYLDVAPTLPSQVMAGRRHFTLEQSFLLAEYFQLAKNDKDFFLATVQKARTSNSKLASYWTEKIRELKENTLTVRSKVNNANELSEEVKAVYYSTYLYSAMRVFCCNNSGRGLEEISAKFKIPKHKALAFLKFLCDNEIIHFKNDRYKTSQTTVFVPRESSYIYRHHTNWRLKAMNKMEDKNSEELFYTCPCSIDKKTFEELKKDILNLIEVALQKATAAPAEDVACLNIDLFWAES